MKRCQISIVGVSPYSSSRKTDDVPMLDRESYDDYEHRVWRRKCTVNKDGIVCVPAMAFKQAIDTCAYKLGIKVTGRRGATYKGFFTSGFFCEADAPLHLNGKVLKPDDAECVTISANSDGIRGSGKRVPRSFPVWSQWETEATFIITDDIISPEIFEQHARSAGVVVGVGRFRPEKGGFNGRFRVVDVKWEDFRI
jgi:hypothetical protein